MVTAGKDFPLNDIYYPYSVVAYSCGIYLPV